VFDAEREEVCSQAAPWKSRGVPTADVGLAFLGREGELFSGAVVLDSRQ
jgi:hypothetical protein